jgi:5-methylcytosine-specific restriction endonuclease McrA
MKKEVRLQVYEKYQGHCGYCGETIEYKDMQVDHVIPQSEFYRKIDKKIGIPDFLSHLTPMDLNHIDNLMPSCRICNKWKDTFDIDGFRKQLSEQLDRLNNYSSNYRIAKKYGLIQETYKPIKFYFEK